MERRNDIMGGEDGTPPAHDLTQIEGIGPKIASRLTASGVLTCADLAERPSDEIIKLLPDITGLSPSKVERWRVHARELAGNTEPPADNRPYESFLVRVLLDESGSIRSTTVQHVQSGEKERWAAWEREALLDFIEGRVTSLPAPEPGPADKRTPQPQPPVESATPDADSEANGETDGETGIEAGGGVSEPDGSAGPRTGITSGLILDLTHRQPLQADGRFAVTMTLDLSAADLRSDRLAYHAIVVARRLGAKTRCTVASEDGVIPVSAPTIRLEGKGLPAGTYRLEAAVSLREPGAAHAGGLAATAESLTLEIPAN